ncbi:MAG: hypothetical protein HKL79_00305 [Thermoplasmata archaeon]|nr:hypothetical protein [Thermoplasmata archaeon]
MSVAIRLVEAPGFETTMASGKEVGAEAGLVVTTIVAGPCAWIVLARAVICTVNEPSAATVAAAGVNVAATPPTVIDEMDAPAVNPAPVR